MMADLFRLSPRKDLWLEGLLIEPDPELARRNEERIAQAREALGEKWAAHPKNRIRKEEQ